MKEEGKRVKDIFRPQGRLSIRMRPRSPSSASASASPLPFLFAFSPHALLSLFFLNPQRTQSLVYNQGARSAYAYGHAP